MVEYDEDEDDEDIEEERIVVQDTRARSPSINRGSGGSVISVQPQSFYPPQEFKVGKINEIGYAKKRVILITVILIV
jgi:hypothetical protein